MEWEGVVDDANGALSHEVLWSSHSVRKKLHDLRLEQLVYHLALMNNPEPLWVSDGALTHTAALPDVVLQEH